MLAPHLTPANHGEVLAAARHRSKQGIQELIASLNPGPAAATFIQTRGPAYPRKRDPAPVLAAAPELETSVPMNAALTSSAGRNVAATDSASVPRGGRHATRAGTLQATGDADARDA